MPWRYASNDFVWNSSTSCPHVFSCAKFWLKKVCLGNVSVFIDCILHQVLQVCHKGNHSGIPIQVANLIMVLYTWRALQPWPPHWMAFYSPFGEYLIGNVGVELCLPDPPKQHVSCRHADMLWKCWECCPVMLSNSVIKTLQGDTTCHVTTMSADMLVNIFWTKKCHVPKTCQHVIKFCL